MRQENTISHDGSVNATALQPPANIDTQSTTCSTPPVPGYELGELLGRGGMGVVYRAIEQKFDRPVAIKFLRDHYPTAGIAAERFVEEARITAQLQHPGIPPIHDLGTLENGRPWLAMKLIKGRSLEELIKSKAPLDVLGLFEPICRAVGYAHAHGVVHRDLKPANVMVGTFGEVQVMDWGLAKIMDRSDRGSAKSNEAETTIIKTGSSDATSAGSIMGTPAYMPPEQAIGAVDAVCPASDVFSLGGVLCALLTGLPPFVAEDGESTRRLAAQSKLEDAYARLQISTTAPEIVALCRRCLSPEIADRFADGNAVADEVAQLRREAEERAKQAEIEKGKAEVEAAAQRRQRKMVIGGFSAVAAVLVAGIIGTFIGLKRAESEKANAIRETAEKELARQAEAERAVGERRAKDDAERQKGLALVAEANAEKRLANVEKANAIMASIFRSLDPKEIARAEKPLQAILVEKIDRAIELLVAESIGDDLVVAKMQSELGLSLLGLGKPDKAIIVFDRCRAIMTARLGVDHPDVLSCVNNLAIAYKWAGRLELALPLYEETLKGRTAAFGPNHPATILSRNNLASAYLDAGRLDLALPILRETHERNVTELGPDDISSIRSLNNLATAYLDAGRPNEALPLMDETLKRWIARMGPDHPETLGSMNNLAFAYKSAGQLSQALPIYEETLKRRIAILGPDHPDTLMTMNNLATGYLSAGRLEKALPILEETLERRVARLGPDHPETLGSMNNLAFGYSSAKQMVKALPLYEETLIRRIAKLGPDHPDTLMTMNNLAGDYKSVGRLAEALPLSEETVKRRIAKLGADHPITLTSMNNLANCYMSVGKKTDSLPLLEKTLSAMKARMGPDYPDVLTCTNNLAIEYAAVGRRAEALILLEGIARNIENRKFQHEHAQFILPTTANTYEDDGQWSAAEAWRRKWTNHLRKSTGPASQALCRELIALGINLMKQSKWPEAERIWMECLPICRKIAPQAWSVFWVESMLGEALMRQEKPEAEKHLLAGIEGLRNAQGPFACPPGSNHLRYAIERLTALYKNDPEKRREWESKLPREYAPVPRKKIEFVPMTFEDVMAGIEKRVKEREGK